MPLVVIHSERFADHQTPPGHPERPERAEIMDVVAGEWRRQGGEIVAPRSATNEQLGRVHAPEHLRRIADAAGRAVSFDPDTYTSPETSEIALLAAGAAIEAVERVMGGRRTRALALVRPPGHHAERNRAMGFCVYNNLAVAAAHARAVGTGRLAIVDFDVHHGNGTQQMFDEDPSILYVSIHQFPFYPGTGAVEEVGRGPGRGFTVNVPVEVGATDEDFRIVFAEIVAPVLRRFKPELILVSAGFDAHERDPLGGMRLTSAAFAAMTADLRQIADECCDGRIAVVTEGGYDLRALAESLLGLVDVLGPDETPRARWPACALQSERGRTAADACKLVIGRYWNL